MAKDDVVRWRRADLARAIEARFGVVLAEHGIGTLLRRLGFTRLVVRPRHLPRCLTERLPFAPDDKETWYTGGARGYADYPLLPPTRRPGAH